MGPSMKLIYLQHTGLELFLSSVDSGVPPSCLQGRSGLGAPAPPLDAALNRQRNVSFTPYDGTHHPTHKQGRPGVKNKTPLTSQTNCKDCIMEEQGTSILQDR